MQINHPKIETFNIKNLVVRLYEEDTDKLITRQRFVSIQNTITDIYFDDCFGTHIELIDKATSLLLYKYKFSLMKRGKISMNMIDHQNRVFDIDGNIHRIQVSTSVSHSVHGKQKNKSFDEWIRNRKYEQELKELEKSKAFVQYFEDDKEKALSDVREIINKYGEKGAYLWDPYLSAKDIKNTLYFIKSSYVDFKAITGLKQGSAYVKNIISNLQWLNTTNRVSKVILLDFQYYINGFVKKTQKQQTIHEMQIEFNKDDKQFLFLNLEVRGKVGTSGYDFHDRFLIFPLEKPRVWSLGISVNQLGASHHILQEVKNAQHILNAFDKLWDELNSEECLVWKSN